jgi:hypothetical protein
VAGRRVVTSETAFDTSEALAAFLTDHPEPVLLNGSGTKSRWRVPSSACLPLRFIGKGLVSHSPADQVAVFRAGTLIVEAQKELLKTGEVIPLPTGSPAYTWGTLGGEISMNLPHQQQAQFGSWRDWVLGMTVVLANGDIVVCGSKAVKNVAGYDLHKLFVGARGTLGVITEVVLRTYALSKHQALQQEPLASTKADWIQRTRRSDFSAAAAAAEADLVYADSESSTLWAAVGDRVLSQRFPHDWVLRSGSGEQNIEVAGDAARALMSRIKQKVDPSGRFNPGEFGFL